MAWNRQLELTVRTQVSRSGDTWNWTDTIVDGLHMSFRVTRSIVFNDNVAEIQVYNASKATRQLLHKPGSNVILRAGYEDTGLGTIYIGNIIKAHSAKQGPDYITTLQTASLRSKEKPFQSTPVALSFSPGTPMNTVLDTIGQTLGLIVAGVSADFPLPNGWTYAGSVRGALTYCEKVLKANDLSLFADLAEMIVFRKGEPSDFDAVYLDYTCGLLSANDISDNVDLTQETIQAVLETGNETDVETAVADTVQVMPKKLELNCILIPKSRPNGLVRVKYGDGEGNYIVDTLTHTGDNFSESSWNTVMEVSSE